MCKPISAIVTPDGDIKYNLWTSSHEDLVRMYKLNDAPTPSGEPRFARIEYHPKDTKDMGDISKYKLVIDEHRCPEWFDEKLTQSVESRMKILVSGIIVTGEVDFLCGGVFILAKGARVKSVQDAIIIVMLDSSSVGEMRESSKVGRMRVSSSVGEMSGSSSVGEMLGSSSVGEMRGSSKVANHNSAIPLPK